MRRPRFPKRVLGQIIGTTVIMARNIVMRAAPSSPICLMEAKKIAMGDSIVEFRELNGVI